MSCSSLSSWAGTDADDKFRVNSACKANPISAALFEGETQKNVVLHFNPQPPQRRSCTREEGTLTRGDGVFKTVVSSSSSGIHSALVGRCASYVTTVARGHRSRHAARAAPVAPAHFVRPGAARTPLCARCRGQDCGGRGGAVDHLGPLALGQFVKLSFGACRAPVGRIRSPVLSSCSIDIYGQTCVVTASYLSDPLRELVSATNHMLSGGTEARFPKSRRRIRVGSQSGRPRADGPRIHRSYREKDPPPRSGGVGCSDAGVQTPRDRGLPDAGAGTALCAADPITPAIRSDSAAKSTRVRG